MMKTISRIKFENILSFLMIPYYIYQFIVSSGEFKLLSIVLSMLLAFGLFYGIKETRKDFKEIAPEIDEEIKNTIESIVSVLKQIKKETLVKAKSIYHKRNASKSLSYSIIIQNS